MEVIAGTPQWTVRMELPLLAPAPCNGIGARISRHFAFLSQVYPTDMLKPRWASGFWGINSERILFHCGLAVTSRHLQWHAELCGNLGDGVI